MAANFTSAVLDLSVIIVNWNSKDYVRKCLQSIYTHTRDLSFEVIVVDGASFDGCDTMLAQEFPAVVFIQSPENGGFAKANNLGFQKARGKNLLFLNPDTELDGPAIHIIYSALNSLPQAGAVGAKLLNSDRTLQTSCVQSLPTILNQTFDSELLRDWFPTSRLWGMQTLHCTAPAPTAVEVLSGACIMAKREVFEQIGQFSTEYFMYSEDLDLCYKIQQAGYRNYYVPAATIIHHGGGSTHQSRSQFSNVMMRQSVWRFLTKTKGRCYGVAYRAAMTISSVCRLLALALAWPLRALRGQVDGTRSSIRKWTAILSWSLGRETWLRKYRE